MVYTLVIVSPFIQVNVYDFWMLARVAHILLIGWASTESHFAWLGKGDFYEKDRNFGRLNES